MSARFRNLLSTLCCRVVRSTGVPRNAVLGTPSQMPLTFLVTKHIQSEHSQPLVHRLPVPNESSKNDHGQSRRNHGSSYRNQKLFDRLESAVEGHQDGRDELFGQHFCN